jgi:hypothetical protein
VDLPTTLSIVILMENAYLEEHLETNTVILYTIFNIKYYYWSRDSIAGIATGYGLDDRAIEARVPVESRIYSSSRRPNRL